MHGEHHADDRAQRVCRVDLSNGRLPGAAPKQRSGEKRQRHAGEKGRRQHHQRGDAGAGEIEHDVARAVAREALHQRLHQRERHVVQRQRGEGGDRHRDLHAAQQPLRRLRRIDAPAHGQPAQRQAEDESGEHQLEGVGRSSEHERQHANPADLVNERGEAGEERRGEQQINGFPGLAACRLQSSSGRGPGDQPDEQSNEDIEQARGAQRSRKPERSNHDETARENAERRAQAVGEVQHRDRFPGGRGVRPGEAGAHQREGHSQKEGLRRDEQPAQGDFLREHQPFRARGR